jgi:hypothetical protein
MRRRTFLQLAALTLAPVSGPPRLSGAAPRPPSISGCREVTADTVPAPAYDIDLRAPERERWKPVIDKEATLARRLADEALRAIGGFYKWLHWPVGAVPGRVYRLMGGLYVDELRAWGEAMNFWPSALALINCAYELSHLDPSYKMGCTAGARWIDPLGMVHVRNLDWHPSTLGRGTRIFRFHGPDHDFVTVGFPGFVGVLSGMVPRRYSVTINWAPPQGIPNFEFSPAFLLRRTLETCGTYEAAIRRLETTRLSTSAFFTVVGAERGQACVIERTKVSARMRRAMGDVIVHANDYMAVDFAGSNEAIRRVAPDEVESEYLCSQRRRVQLHEALASLPGAGSEDALMALLRRPPLLNDQTCQQMIFYPTSGGHTANGVVPRPRRTRDG